MKLRLYSSETINFNNNGLGSLNDAFNATVKEEVNGEYSLTFSYPVNGRRFKDLINDNLVVAKPNETDDDHAFRIISTIPDFSGLYTIVTAETITNDIRGVAVENFSGDDKGQVIASKMELAFTKPSGLSLSSDIQTKGKVLASFTNLLALFIGTENSLLSSIGGELKRTNQGLQLLNRRGRNYPIKFSLHKNISGIKITTDTSSVITGILPYVTYTESGDSQKEVTIVGDIIKAGNAGDYVVQKIQPTAIPSRRSADTTSSTDQSLPIVENKEQLMTAAKAYYQGTSFVNSSYPNVTVEINVASVQKSTDYKQFENITDVGLFDTVKVDLSDYGLSYDMKVTEIQYDPIQERVVSVTLGKNKKNFSSSIQTEISKNTQAIDNITNVVNATAISANGKNSTTWGDVIPDNPREGDIWFQKEGDYEAIWVYADGEWKRVSDSNTQAEIKEAVDLAVNKAKENTATAIEQNNTSQQEIMNDIAKSQADLAIKDGDFNNKAQAMADKALSDAKANTVTVAQETLDTANQNLAAAKSDLTDGLQKEVSDRTSAVTELDTKAQGYANTAKTDALNTIADEVTNRQNAVSALDTKATNAVNQAKSDINDTINAISVGGRNLLLGTATSFTGIGSNSTNGNFNPQGGKYSLAGGKKVSDLYNQYGSSRYLTISFDWVASGSTISGQFNPQWSLSPYGGLSNGGAIKPSTTNTSGHYVSTVQLSTNGYSNGLAGSVEFRQDNLQGNITISNLKLEAGNKATDWTPAPEDIVLDYTTKDNQIKETITQYKDTNDGKVSKAQTDATTALGQVATKVSQTDYDTKTGDLTTKYTQVKQTTDLQATDIVDIKETATSQASKINSISSDVDGTKQSISDIETTQDSQSDKINQITIDVNGTKQSITDIQSKDGQQDTRMGNIETSVSGVKSDFSTYKTDANGRISTAQTTAQTAVDGLKTKVSQTDYNTKTGQLQTDLTTTTQTANQAKTDIVSIKQKDSDQDAKMNTIVSDANGTKQTVSDLQTAQGKQSGDISTLQQRADGFDATVTKVDNLAVGGRNLLLGTNSNSKSSLNPGNGSYTTQYVAFDNGYKYNFSYTMASTNWAVYMFSGLQKDKFNPDTDYILSFMANVSTDIKLGVLFASGSAQHNFVKQVTTPTILSSNGDQKVVIQLRTNSTIPDESDQSLYINGFVNKVGTFSIWDLKIETGNLPTDYTPAPEDIDSATAKAQLTADQATTELNAYKTNADGRISKAQSDIVQTAKDVTTKVSQTDYNAKTGDLSTKVSTAQQTADSAVTTIGNYKTSNDNRVKATETSIAQNTKDITLRATNTDLDSAKKDYNAQIAQVKVNADSITSQVSSIQTKINSMGQVNQLANTEFNPDMSGWYSSTFGSSSDPIKHAVDTSHVMPALGQGYNTSNAVLFDTTDQTSQFYARLIQYVPVTGGISVSMSWYVKTLIYATYTNMWITFWDKSGKEVANTNKYANWSKGKVTNQWDYIALPEFTNISVPDTAVIMRIAMESREGVKQLMSQFMVVFDSTVGDYVSGAYNSNDKVATQQITIDGITNIVSDPTTGLSTRVQTAEGTLSTIKGTDIPALKNATFWQPYSSLNFNDYTKQGSIFFNTTAAKTNGPTTSNSWLYLMVEQGTSDNGRIKQTAWYDGVAGVKITYVRTLNSGTWSPWYANDNDSVTTISQTNSNVTQEISDRKTGDSNTLQSSKDFTTSSITSAVNGVNSTITQTSNAILAKVGATNLFPNSEFSQSYGYAASGTVNISGSTKYDTENRYSGQVSVTSTSAGYQGYWTEMIPVYGGKKYSASVLVHYSNGGLSSGQALLDIWFFDKDNQRISSGSRATGQVSSPYWVKLSNEGFTAPINAVKVQVSLIVNNAGAGQVATFAQPMVTATEKLQEYTPNDDISSQLSLLKDNWSIGISDNIGAITSGIVGNSNSMSLISKNVIIDSPSTQITGTAWINAAMIKDGSIGTAKIGDASITSAKIISLDVARLTGNVSNFIQSNWNGIYGSTVITADGMTVSSGSTTTSFGSGGMRITMASSGGVVMQGATKSDGAQTGVLIGMNVGSTFTSFGFQSSSDYTYKDEMVILKTGSQAAGDYNIGGGVAFNHNVSFMDNIYMKYGKGFYGKWGDPQQAIFFQTINSGIPAIMHISGAGIAFGHKGDLYMLSHGGWQDFNNPSIKGSYTVDQPWITG